MSKLYDELVPVPKDCRVHNCNGRVNSLIITEEGQKPKRKVVGRICPPDALPQDIAKQAPPGMQFMYPNDSYFDTYGAEYVNFNPKGAEKVKKNRLSVGIYALVLAIAIKLGLYDLLIKNYGADNANAILDYAMYSIIYQKDEANTFSELMGNHVLFCRRVHSDKWYSAFFKNVMTEEANQNFCDDWLEYNISERRVSEVSISVDGTNLNCESKTNSMAAIGHAKSNKHIKIVTMLWAVIADGPHKGMPLTYAIDVGSIPDNVEMSTMIELWQEHEIAVKMSIYDRGFPNDRLLHELTTRNIPFLVMLKENNIGFQTMFEKHWLELQTDFSYVLEGGRIAGVTEDNIRPYKNSDLQLCTGLFYDSVNGAERRAHCALMLMRSREEWEQKLNQRKAASDKAGKPYSLTDLPKWFFADEVDGIIKVRFRYDRVNEIWRRKGYFAQASSKHMTAQEMNDQYDLRDSSEKQFCVLKSQLGLNVGNVSGVESWSNKLFVMFVASVIRNEIMLACKAEKIDTNKFIQQVAQICYKRTGNYYFFSDNFPGKVEKVLRHFGITKEHLKALSVYVNSRYKDFDPTSNEDNTEVRTIPGLIFSDLCEAFEDRPDKHKETTVEDEKIAFSAITSTPLPEKPKKRGGRKEGCKNLKTREREAREEEERKHRQEAGLPPLEKRKPGRPKGSKNKKTIEKEEAERQKRISLGLPPEEPPKQKRKPGRPAGSKNRKTLEREAAELNAKQDHNSDNDGDDEHNGKSVSQNAPPKPHKGRAKGTKNKKTVEREAREAEMRAAGLLPKVAEKRKPGRPKGTKNQSTLLREENDRRLTSLTGIDILGEKTGKPTSRKVRERLRREAEEKAREIGNNTTEIKL